jgi:hypothetical protein
MATLSPQTIVYTGLIPTYAAAASGGDQFLNDGRTFIQLKNTNAGNRTVTIVTQATAAGRAIADDAVVIPLTVGDKMIGPFPTGIYNDANGYVQLTYDAVTDVTIGVFKLPTG